MTREELINFLSILKEQARNSGVNTFVCDVKIDSFNFVIDSAIKALEQEPQTGSNECMFSDYPDMPYQFDNMTGSMNL